MDWSAWRRRVSGPMRVVPPAPVAPGAWPLLGHAPVLLTDPLGFLRSLAGRAGLVEVRLGPCRAILICDTELTRKALLNDSTFDKGGPLYERVRGFVGNGVITCPHSQHRRQRHLTQPAFTRGRVAEYAVTMARQVDARTAAWTDGQVLHVQSEMMDLALRNALEVMFADSLTDQAVTVATGRLSRVLDGMLWRTIAPAAWLKVPTVGNMRYRNAIAGLRATVASIIAARRAEPGAGTGAHGDLLSILLDSPGAGSAERLTDTEIADQVLTFFAAGTETIASGLTWALYVLAGDSALAQAVREEVDTVLHGQLAAPEHLDALNLVGRVVEETLRMYPPVWMLTRSVTCPTNLGGHFLSPGTVVIYSSYLVHHTPGLYDRPEDFDADRWRDPDRAARRAYVPFAIGARQCMGDRFAWTQMVLALATIASRWELAVAPGTDARPARSTALRPRAVNLRLHARSQKEVALDVSP